MGRLDFKLYFEDTVTRITKYQSVVTNISSLQRNFHLSFIIETFHFVLYLFELVFQGVATSGDKGVTCPHSLFKILLLYFQFGFLNKITLRSDPLLWKSR